MACHHPLLAQWGDAGVQLLKWRSLDYWTAYDLVHGDAQLMRLPCGTCVGCQMSRGREWAFRCELEFNEHQETCWTTLTYNDDHLPPTLRKRHLSGFLKRLRARLHPQRVRFFASGEYGERGGRPHYHAILFGMSDSPEIQGAWPYGHVKTFPLSKALIAYTAGYVSKKVGLRELEEERLDPTTGELYQHQPPFILMSRRPGIGHQARDTFANSWRKQTQYNGATIPVPRYLHLGWRKNASPEQITQLNEEKQQLTQLSLSATESPRLQASAVIANANLKLKAERRTL